jgi:hypothetical protein
MVRILAERASNFDLEAIENDKSALALAYATARIAIFGSYEEKYIAVQGFDAIHFDLSPNPSPTRRGAFPPSLVGKGGRGVRSVFH